MGHTVSIDSFRRSVTGHELRVLGGIVFLEALLVAVYFGISTAEPISVRHVLYPFVWINVGLWAAYRTNPSRVGRSYRVVAICVSIGYFFILATIAGLIGIAVGTETYASTGIRVVMASPGWGPMISYSGSFVFLAFVPYVIIGYGSLAYLVYATIVDATKSLVSGVIGLFSCVGCSFPIIASLVAGFAGGSSALTSAIYSFSIDISTAVFVLAVALLYWRPGFRA